MPPRHLFSLRFVRRAATITIGHLKSTHFPPSASRNGEFFQSRLFSSSRAARLPHGGGGSRTATSAAARSSKSLMDDEAELSDWISDLKADSFKIGSGSDADDFGTNKRSGSSTSSSRNGSFRDSNRDRDRNVDGSSFSSRRGARAARGGGLRRQGDDDIKNSRNTFSKRFGSYLDDDDEESEEVGAFLSPKGRSKNSNNSFSKKFKSDLDDDEDDLLSFSKGELRNSKASLSKKRVDFGSGTHDEDGDGGEEDDEDGFSSSSRGERRNSRGSFGKMGYGRDDDEVGFSSSRVRREVCGGRGRKDMVKGRRDKGVGFGVTSPRGGRSFEFGLSDEELREEDEDDELSGLEDDLFGDEVGKKDEKPLMDAVKNLGSAEALEVGSEAPRKTSGGNESYLSQTRFDECSISPLTLKGVKASGYERMTVVQEATLPVILKGKDVLAKAKTGTGKTVAFLLPAIEVVSKLPPVDGDHRRPPINVLVVCPTRELADQAAAEANKLLKFHPSIGVQLVIGGTRLALEQKSMQTNPCQILVATPGRLRDHIENTAGFATRLMGVKVLVLDEADRLLDMGFRTDIEKIVAAVPKQRQTLLFSATVPDEVRQVCHIAMKRDLEFINTVVEGSEETNAQVKQMHLVASVDKHFSILYGLLTSHISENVDYKVIVFCTTAMVTRLVAELLSELKLNVREIHSRKPQSYRTRISKEFKESKGLILVSSDVSARGVDYPDVTLVIQLGVPSDREQYIHRLGRTGRKGKEGSGILLLATWEEYFLKSIKDLPISEASLPVIDLETRKTVERALSHVEVKDKESAYQAWLGYYNSNKNIGRDKYQLVSLANEFSRSMGLNNPPAVSKLVLRKMGLNNIPGLRSK